MRRVDGDLPLKIFPMVRVFEELATSRPLTKVGIIPQRGLHRSGCIRAGVFFRTQGAARTRHTRWQNRPRTGTPRPCWYGSCFKGR